MEVNQAQSQNMMKISNGQFQDNNIRTVKQRAHKFNAIAIINNSNSSASNIPIPSKFAGNGKVNAPKKIDGGRKNALQVQQIEHVEQRVNVDENDSNNNNNNNNNNNVGDQNNININIINKYSIQKSQSNQNDENMAEIPKNIDINNNCNNNNNNKISKTFITSNGLGDKVSNIATVSPSISNSNQLTLPTNNTNEVESGWFRIFCGPDRSEISIEDPNRMLLIYSNSTVSDVIKELGLPNDYTIWVQVGEKSRRLSDMEYPLRVLDLFLKSLGFLDESRRSRLQIDINLKHLIRFHIGPCDYSLCSGVTKSGCVDLLKGLVFPQWKRRKVAIIGSKLIIYPANQNLMPEMYELSNSDIFEHSPVYNRLIIKIIPKISDRHNNVTELPTRNESCSSSEYLSNKYGKSGGNLNNMGIHHNSNLSISSQSSEVVLFFGFQDSWERDLWSNWLIEVCFHYNEENHFIWMQIYDISTAIIPLTIYSIEK
jgi:PH domain/leucine-rich repeat-containing protein phosphatase